jgi:hypothetical protein
VTNMPKLTAEDVLRRYKEEELPEFLEMELKMFTKSANGGVVRFILLPVGDPSTS